MTELAWAIQSIEFAVVATLFLFKQSRLPVVLNIHVENLLHTRIVFTIEAALDTAARRG